MRKSAPDKQQTGLLDPFEGLTLDHIVVPATAQQFAAAAGEIRAEKIVGFDSESKPVFLTTTVNHGPHLVQFATRDKAFLFQLRRAECHPVLAALLQADDVLKVGFGLGSDRSQIQKTLGVTLRGVLDMNSLFAQNGYRNSTGVRAGVAIVLGRKFHKSKRVTTSNWAAAQLNDKQQLYAANDAYAALCVYRGFNRLRGGLPVMADGDAG
jgi:ribonuclease D